MKRLIAIMALSTAFGVAACDNPEDSSEVTETEMDAPMALPAEDAGMPMSEPGTVPVPPVDSSTLPAEQRSSAESVQPESETLFY